MKSIIASLFVAVVLLSSNFTPAAWAQTQPAGSAPPGYVLVEEDVIITFANNPSRAFVPPSPRT